MSIKNMYDGLKTLQKTGRMSDIAGSALTMGEHFDIIDFKQWMDVEKKFVIRD